MGTTQIAIDGPAGAGKSTIAKRLADNLGFAYIDTGAMYRAVTWKAMRLNVNLDDEDAFDFLDHTRFDYKEGRLTMDGAPLGDDIRSREVSNNVSLVSSHQSVRNIL
ncbi:MAG: (d)CMP kinase, partial [Bacillota bacterium]